MPSENQANTSDDSYRNEAHRFIASDMMLAPVIRGIEDIDRVVLWWNECHRCNADEQTKRMVKDRMEYLRNG
jgi:hypothetical protein